MANSDNAWGGNLPLWDHQVDALSMIRRFLEAPGLPKARNALVRMPTGTGKSGVISVAARSVASSGKDVLLLSPWSALVDQLGADVKGRFWTNLGVEEPKRLPIQRLYPANTAVQLASTGQPSIWTATISTVQQLHGRHPADYAALAGRLGLVVVDEGHYEPARSWSAAVRELNCPSVLFTATPYRNDYKYFDLNRALTSSDKREVPNVSVYKHHEAEANRHLRPVSFDAITFRSTEEFVVALQQSVKRNLKNRDRVIVRCKTRSSVQAVAKALADAGEEVIAIHERFDDTEGAPRLRRSVPDPEITPARYWVHQFKLTEGIDDHRFRLVAFYEPFSSDRPFVQQIGRVLRNPQKGNPAQAWVVHHRDHNLKQSWESYMAYDQAAPADTLPARPSEFAASQPPSQYVAGKFRVPYLMKGPNVHRRFRYPAATRVFRVPANFDLDCFAWEIGRALDDSDYERGEVESPNNASRVHPYIAIRNSQFLSNDAFVEYTVGYITYTVDHRYLLYHDTSGMGPPDPNELSVPSRSELMRLYPDSTSRLTQVSLVNTDLGLNSIRRRSFSARDLGEAAPDLSDYSQITTSSKGSTQSKRRIGRPSNVQRYVGLSTGRVRDNLWLDHEEYQDWLASVAKQLRSGGTTTLPVFGRFAEPIDPPSMTTPAHVLLDFDQALFDFNPMVGAPQPLSIENVCAEVNANSFALDVNGQTFDVRIVWDGGKTRYVLRCADLDAHTTMSHQPGAAKAVPLVAYLNREQSFRVVPEVGGGDHHVIYAGGSFSRPRLPVGMDATLGVELHRLLIPIPELVGCRLEKGDKNKPLTTKWAKGSLFDLVDTLGRGTGIEQHLSDIDLLVCDDIGTEIADWIAVKSQMVAAIHAKASDTPKSLSASALHEVAAQAVKNLGSFQPTDAGPPKNLASWDGPWNGGEYGTVPCRIRRGPKDGQAAWTRIRSELRNPNTSREVWILLGNGLSKSAFEYERLQPNPKPEIVQILYILHGTWSTVASVGAQLRVFCSP